MGTEGSPYEFAPIEGETQTSEILTGDGGAHTKDGSTQPDKGKLAAGRILYPLKRRNFNLFFSGQMVSVIGDALYAVALPWLILSNGGNAQELGIVMTMYGIPRAGTMLIGGWLSDRLRPRRLMLAADFVRALLVGILAAQALWGHPTLWQLCSLAVLLGAMGGIFVPALLSILPDILNDDELQAGNALTLASLQCANLIGASLAGVVVAAFTAGMGLAIDAATFIVSAVSLVMMRVDNPITGHKSTKGKRCCIPQNSTYKRDAQISFWLFLRISRQIQVILLISIATGFCFGGLLEVALPTLVHGPMHGGASGYGAILAGWSAGALGGGLLVGTLGKRKHKGLLMLCNSLVMAVSLALLPLWGIPGAVICMLIGGVANSITNVLLLTILQLISPRHLMGRVMGLLMFGTFGMYPFSAALAGVLSNQFGPAIFFPLSGLLLALVMLFGLTQKVVRVL